jgi:predicted transcriptional regulator
VGAFTTAGETASRDTRLLELQTEHPSLFFAAADAVRSETQRAIITAINAGVGSATYDEITEYAAVSNRTIRKHVSNLESDGLVERESDGLTSAVSFASFEAEVLITHVLTCYYDDHDQC